MDGAKDLIHAKKWDVYNSEKEALVNVGCLVEVTDKEGKKVIWEVVNDHVVVDGVEHEELGLQGLILFYLMKIARAILKSTITFDIPNLINYN